MEDANVKLEVIDEETAKLILLNYAQMDQDEQEIADNGGSVEVKTEPDDAASILASLYVDHQFKNELVIGPTELLKETRDSSNTPDVADGNLKNENVNKARRGRPPKKKQGRPKTSDKTRAEQRREASKRYRLKHPEAHRRAVKRYNEKHPEVHRSAVKRYREKRYKMISSAVNMDNNSEVNQIAEGYFEIETKYVPEDWSCEPSQPSLYVDDQNKDGVVSGPAELDEHGVKTEPESSDRSCEGLYVDHQIKEELVIGPTELLQQSAGSFQDLSVFVCNICTKSYKRKSSYTKHMNTHGAPATSADKHEKHRQGIKKENIKEEKSSLKTDFKDENFDKSDNNNVKLIEADNLQNKCVLCFKIFAKPAGFLRHMNQFHSDKVKKKFFCEKCDMSFSRSDYLIRHKLIRHAEGKQILYCECGKKFFDKWSYTRHDKGYCVLKTSRPEKLICDYCNKSFCNKYRLTEHIKRHLNNKFKTLICDYCNKHFHRRFEIERHMLQHLGVSMHTFKCKICNKKFTRNWSLKKHLVSHSGKKPFNCRYCMRAFVSKWGCTCHERRCN